MTERIKQLQTELESYEANKLNLEKESDFIKALIKAEDKKIKALRELIESCNAYPKETN